jgi:signal transduction histidine kinase
MRKITLGAYLLLIYVGIDLFFFIVNLFNEEGKPWSLFSGFAISSGCLLLLRMGYVNTAIVIHLIRSNALAYYFCEVDIDPLHTGSYLYFIPSSLGALAVFGYRERWKGIGFTILSYFLFSLAIFKLDQFHPNDAHFYLIVSFMIVLIIGILIVIFFDRMVQNSENRILAKNEELLKANQELDRFVYSASHDLRAPLTSMAGLIHLAQRDQVESPYYLSLMHERLKVMDNYIRDIVEYSRNTRLDLMYNEVQMKALVEDVISSLKYAVDVSKVNIDLQIGENITVKTDQSRLRVVLNNLIGNGFKYQDFTKPNPFLKIFTSREDGLLKIHIEDNGIGIREEHHPRIFEMFYRANDLTEGSGLGLYIARETIARLQGAITFSSSYGYGSRFTISIPVKSF